MNMTIAALVQVVLVGVALAAMGTGQYLLAAVALISAAMMWRE